MSDIISREEAAKLGLNKYFTGKPCKRGHVTFRYVTNTKCLDCFAKFYAARNVFTEQLQRYATDKLWAPRDMTREQRVMLRYYLQTCIYQFTQQNGLATPAIEAAIEHHGHTPPDFNDPRVQD